MGAQTRSVRGRLLLDGGNLRGSWFHRTVVLVCQHDAEGAFGLVLNRPSGNQFGDAVVAPLSPMLKELPLFLGGPVQAGALSYLHTDAVKTGSSVMDQLTLGHSLDELVELMEEAPLTRRLRVFAGYSGWSAGQLDEELAREAWLVEPATLDLVMGNEPTVLWRRIIEAKGGKYRLLASSPDDYSVN